MENLLQKLVFMHPFSRKIRLFRFKKFGRDFHCAKRWRFSCKTFQFIPDLIADNHLSLTYFHTRDDVRARVSDGNRLTNVGKLVWKDPLDKYVVCCFLVGIYVAWKVELCVCVFKRVCNVKLPINQKTLIAQCVSTHGTNFFLPLHFEWQNFSLMN